jgi:hypothetical protein
LHDKFEVSWEVALMSDYGTLLRDHVTLRCRSIDRMFLQAYIPRLQAVGDVCTYLRWQWKYPIPSSAFGKIGDAYVKAVYRFAESQHIPVVLFKRAEKKEETAQRWPISITSISISGIRNGGVLENQRLCTLSYLAMAQWPRVGQTAVGESRHQV